MKRNDIMETIRELKEMFFAGAITEEEFQRLKMEFLEEMNLLPSTSSSSDASQPSHQAARAGAFRHTSAPSARSSSNPFMPKARTSKSSPLLAQQNGVSEIRGVPIASATPIPNTLQSVNHSSGPFEAQSSSITVSRGRGASGSGPGARPDSSGMSPERRQQQFMSMYTKATQQAAEEPERALHFMEEARVLAPELVDDVFRQWMEYAKHILSQKREMEQGQDDHTQNSIQQISQASMGSFAARQHEDSTNPEFEMPKSLVSDAPVEKEEDDDPVAILLEGVNDLLSEEDFAGAIVLLEHLRGEFPELEKINSLYQLCRDNLAEDYHEKYEGASSTFPALTCSPKELMEMRNKMDHRVGFLVSQIDGNTSLSELVMISGLEEFDVYRLVEKLTERGVLKVIRK